uniref:Doublecortin domain containing 2B n=1 Tax=Amphiprion percula TaxID=161767 RepID=A0A3P8TLE9_AMPPE
MAASTAATFLLPPVKNVVVYRNGDPFYTGRRFVVNQRQVATMEAFLNEVTHNIGAPLAVRTLYTPRQGHRVTDLQDLQTGAQYVAECATGLHSAHIKQIHLNSCQVQYENKCRTFHYRHHVFRNGDLLCPPFRFIIPRSMQQDLEQILSLITEKVSLRTGAVRRSVPLSPRNPLINPGELETGHCYVAVGTERFKKLPYVELLVSKATERYCYARSSVCVQKYVFMCNCSVFQHEILAPSVFKRAGRKRREEVRGAEEVQEDENTATELPVDQVSFIHVCSIFI